MTTHTASCRCGQLSATRPAIRFAFPSAIALPARSAPAAPFRRRRAGRQSASKSKANRAVGQNADSGQTHYLQLLPGLRVRRFITATAISRTWSRFRSARSTIPISRPGLFGVGTAQARLGRYPRRRRRAHRLRSAAPRVAIDAQEIAAHQLLEPRLAPAALLQGRRRSGGSGRRCCSRRPSARRRGPRPARRCRP